MSSTTSTTGAFKRVNLPNPLTGGGFFHGKTYQSGQSEAKAVSGSASDKFSSLDPFAHIVSC